MRMENNSTIVGVGVTALILVVSYFVYKQMGCTTSTPVGSKEKKEESESKKEKKDAYPAGKISIFFGSQTGTAEGFARTLMEEGKANGFDARTVDLEDFDPDTMINDTDKAVFLMATYGEGEPTDNAITFAKWLKNSDGELSEDALKNLNFTVFGLGNKQYEHYNMMGKATNANLEKVGANRMFEYGEGDDDATLEEDFEAWKAPLWPALVKKFHPSAGAAAAVGGTPGAATTPQKVQLMYHVVDAGDGPHSPSKVDSLRVDGSENSSLKSGKINSTTRHFFSAPRAKMLVNRELRTPGKGESGSTRHIELDLQGVGLEYLTADNLAILPENQVENVTSLAAAQGYDLDYRFIIVPEQENAAEYKASFPTPCSVSELLTCYLDIQGPMKQGLLKQLLPYVGDKQQAAWLEGMMDKDRRAEWKAFSEDNGASLCSLLTNELSSCLIPLSDLLHIVPFIQPRYYTISSSSSCFPGTVHITVSITEFGLKNGSQFTGLTSGYLKTAVEPSNGHKKPNVSDNCRVFVRASSFRLPESLSTPIIMIGPGTGLAPMRALLQERKYQQEKLSQPSGQNILFFGCKYQSVDYIYRDELEQYEKEGVLHKLHTAFSRDGPKKVYVQHLIEDAAVATELVDLVCNQGAYVYVCGATAMGTDVMSAFVRILQQQKKAKMKTEQASAFIKDLQEKGRYVQELWTA
mmetsp:Transcript_7916/g.13118  ORF Transcript_7916/g.13118 Transcript_7916/m.13118 type:complete len:693 (+) Transcript_7916:93-2171(+)